MRLVRKSWTDGFVPGPTELRTRFSRGLRCLKRTVRENPHTLEACFRLVFDMLAKFGIQHRHLYSVDEAAFALGMIRAQMTVTSSDRVGKPMPI